MTTPLRLRIVDAASPEAPGYEGMDRPWLSGVPEPLVLRGLWLEDLTPDEVLEPWQTLRAELDGFASYELIALGDVAGPEWEALGFDVGETTPRAWSAVAHRAELFPPEELESWDRLLNRHGLFADREAAERFLIRYLASDDPDMGWTESGWDDSPSFYAVVAIHRLRRG